MQLTLQPTFYYKHDFEFIFSCSLRIYYPMMTFYSSKLLKISNFSVRVILFGGI